MQHRTSLVLIMYIVPFVQEKPRYCDDPCNDPYEATCKMRSTPPLTTHALSSAQAMSRSSCPMKRIVTRRRLKARCLLSCSRAILSQHQPQQILSFGSPGGASVVINPRGFNTGRDMVPAIRDPPDPLVPGSCLLSMLALAPVSLGTGSDLGADDDN